MEIEKATGAVDMGKCVMNDPNVFTNWIAGNPDYINDKRKGRGRTTRQS